MKNIFEHQLYRIAIALLLFGILLTIFSWIYLGGNDHQTQRLDQLVVNLGISLFTMGLTVLIIDTLSKERDKTELKKQLQRDMRIPISSVSVSAAARYRVEGWHKDESLIGTA